MNPSGHMKRNIKSLGWFIRFAPQTSKAGSFYPEKIGLPLIRHGDADTVDFFWAGEALVIESIYVKGKASAQDPDPATAALVPFFRTTDLDACLARYRAAGLQVIGPEARGKARQGYVLDCDGQLIGLRQVAATSACAFDREAMRRTVRGEAFNPGCAPMPKDIYEVGWVTRRVVDVEKMAAFYRDVVGLPQIRIDHGYAQFDLGDNSILELAPGGKARDLPTNRYETPCVFILRVFDSLTLKTALKSQGVRFVHDHIQWDRGQLSYFADPENNLVGIEQRYHPGRYAPKQIGFPEDLEAERRWRELDGPVPV